MAKLSRIVPSCGRGGSLWKMNQAHPISVKTLWLLLPFTDMSECISGLRCRREESRPASETGSEDSRCKHSKWRRRWWWRRWWRRPTVPLKEELLLGNTPPTLLLSAWMQQCNSSWKRARLQLGPLQPKCFCYLFPISHSFDLKIYIHMVFEVVQHSWIDFLQESFSSGPQKSSNRNERIKSDQSINLWIIIHD